MIYSWELSASRSVERIGAKDYTDCEPFGYAMTGAFEVSGSLVIKRDLSVADFMSKLSSDSVGVNVGKASGGLLIGVPTAKIDASSIDNGGSFLKQTIPFKAYSSTNSAGNIFSITTG